MKSTDQHITINNYYGNCGCNSKNESTGPTVEDGQNRSSRHGDLIDRIRNSGATNCHLFNGSKNINTDSSFDLNVIIDPETSKNQLIYAEPVIDTCNLEAKLLAILANFKKKKGKYSVHVLIEPASNIPDLGIKEASFVRSPSGIDYELSVVLGWGANGSNDHYPVRGFIPKFASGKQLRVEVSFPNGATQFPKVCRSSVIVI